MPALADNPADNEARILRDLEPLIRSRARWSPPSERQDVEQEFRLAAISAIRRWSATGRQGGVAPLAERYIWHAGSNLAAKRRTRTRRLVQQDPNWSATGREPQPDDVAALHDEIEKLLRQADELTGRLLRRMLSGASLTDAAKLEGVSFNWANQKMIQFRRLVAPPKPKVRIEQIDIESGEVVATYPTLRAASQALNVNRRELASAAERCGTARGFRWRRRVGGPR